MVSDLTLLRSFVEVVERGTVAAAAAATGYTAPAISQHLARLERQLGSALFDRVGGRLVPTGGAVALLPVAHRILDLAGSLPAVVGRRAGRPAIVIAGFASALATVVAPLLDRLDEVATVTLVESEDDEALRELRLGRVDLALVQSYSRHPSPIGDRMDRVTVVSDRLRLVVPPGHPAKRLTDLVASPWLVNGRATQCAAATHRILADAGITPIVVGEIADNATLLNLVAVGRGVTIIPEAVLTAAGAAAIGVDVLRQDLGEVRTIEAVTRRAARGLVGEVLALLTASPPAPAGPERRS